MLAKVTRLLNGEAKIHPLKTFQLSPVAFKVDIDSFPKTQI